MTTAQKREIADRIAQLAVDEVDIWFRTIVGEVRLWPEDFLDLQRNLEDLFYRELSQGEA